MKPILLAATLTNEKRRSALRRKQTPSCKISAEQHFATDSRATLQVKDLRIELLISGLQIRNLLSDLVQ